MPWKGYHFTIRAHYKLYFILGWFLLTKPDVHVNTQL